MNILKGFYSTAINMCALTFLKIVNMNNKQQEGARKSVNQLITLHKWKHKKTITIAVNRGVISMAQISL